ncbi:major facilitator superfamily domain-containing protein [Penicillium crustosum]|uniref:major facilitator superfamily domain-containing protein n=1 Tax=Penicillium crustosum TaxID=36656 RepID=UPI002397A23B|nr:major facilitator superfamily domain-containing protein [Penicillium crustosum]KAJ5396198.1 major facilitator superfamily domain-containing protein [Penicillium crustosum]
MGLALFTWDRFYLDAVSSQNIQHGVAGIPLAFYAAGVTIGALAAGRLVTRWEKICHMGRRTDSDVLTYVHTRAKRCKKLSLIATGVLIASCTLMVIRWRYVPQWWDFAYVLLAGSGIGAQFSIQFISLSQLGGIFGTATSAGLLRTTFRRQLNKHLFNIPNAHKIIAGVLRDSRFIFSFPETIQLLVRSSYLKSFQVLPTMLLVDDIPIL